MKCAVTLLILLAPILVMGQIDDLVDGAWAAPSLDILETRRERPLCLRCCDAHDLTEIPGISKSLALAIVRMVKSSSIATITDLCDTLCCSSDQFILLTSCTSLTCTCMNIVRSVDSRLRIPTSLDGTTLARLNIEHAWGRAGVAFASIGNLPQQIIGAWATARVAGLTITLGDHALQIGSGLLMGTARGLTRSVGDEVLSLEDRARARAWTSTARAGVLTGVSITGPIPRTKVDGTLEISNRDAEGRKETVVLASAAAPTPIGDLHFALGHIRYNQPSSSRSSSVIQGTLATLASATWTHASPVGTFVSELLLDDAMRAAVQIGIHKHEKRHDVGLLAWWFHPDIRSPFGTASGLSSAVANSSGAVGSLRIRQSAYTVALSVAYRMRPSRSFLSPLPTSEIDVIADATSTRMGILKASGRVRYQRSNEAITIEDHRLMDRQDVWGLRLDAELQVTKTVSCRVRLDARTSAWDIADTVGRGILLFFDAQWMLHTHIRIHCRWTQFSSNNGSIAPRMMEVGVAGSLQTVVASGSGHRWMLALRWETTPWLSASCVVHEDRRVVNSKLVVDRSALFQIDLRLGR